ncbi:MAG TPA: DUF5752 family protein [Verrucomicrobiae bacterium]|nr:DUF5752 family protein [Verrucomicrobiae bacterium]
MTTAQQPFQFVTASYLTRVENFKVETIAGLNAALAEAGDSAIFFHTFQTLGRHHFLTEGFSNDFAQWVLASLNQPVLAERLASIDVRDYMTIQEVRADLRRILGDFCEQQAGCAELRAFEPFYFCSATEVTLPLPWDARTLAGVRAGLERLSHSSFYYHFIASRLRLGLRTNDFSNWFRIEMGAERLADRTDRIDVYTNTLDSARRELIGLVDAEIGS